MPLTFGMDVLDEGAFAQVSCIVSKGDEPLQVSWSFHGSSLTSNLGIITTPIGSRGSMLLISSVQHSHRGNYTCIAKNNAGVVTNTVELKVNGKSDSQEGTNVFSYFRTPRYSPAVLWKRSDG